MKRFLFYCISLLSFLHLYGAEQSNISELYKKLPSQLFFRSPSDGIFSVNLTQMHLSESAFKNLLTSPIILNALNNNKGSENSPIDIPISQEELLSFMRFVQNLDMGDLDQAYNSEFSDQDTGIRIMEKLKLDDKIIAIVRAIVFGQKIPQLESLKRKRETEEETSASKKVQSESGEYRMIHIRLAGAPDFITLTSDQFWVLRNIQDSLIAHTIESNPGMSIIYLDVPKNINMFELEEIAGFLEIARKFYTGTKDVRKLIKEHLPEFWGSIEKFSYINNLKDLITLADWFGYYELAKTISELIPQLSYPYSFNIILQLKEINKKAVNNKLPPLVTINSLLSKKIITGDDAKDIKLLIEKMKQLLILAEWIEIPYVYAVMLDFLVFLEKLESYLENANEENLKNVIEGIHALTKGIVSQQLKTEISPVQQVLWVLRSLFKDNAKILEIIENTLAKDPSLL